MDRVRNALGNFVTGFLTAFVVVSVVRDRKTGVRAGLAWGAVSAVLSYVVAGKLDGMGHVEDLPAEEHALDGAGTSD